MCWDRIIEAETPGQKPVKQLEPSTPNATQRPVAKESAPALREQHIPELVETS